MHLYLMRHGPYLAKHDDPEEGLSPQGAEVVRGVSYDLKDLGVSPDLVLSSPKKRAKQTAAIAAEVLGYPRDEILETKLVKSMTPPEETIQYLSGLKGESILSVGHLPSVRLVASLLLTGNDRLEMLFEAGSVCALDIQGSIPGPAGLNWLLTPRT
jgi:phosphohistidine phosphatase